MKSVAESLRCRARPGGSAVYNFKVKPAGPEATNLSVNATFSTPLHVPLHPVTDFQCVSRGNQEARLLKEIEAAAQVRTPSNAPTSTSRSNGLPGGAPLCAPALDRGIHPGDGPLRVTISSNIPAHSKQ